MGEGNNTLSPHLTPLPQWGEEIGLHEYLKVGKNSPPLSKR